MADHRDTTRPFDKIKAGLEDVLAFAKGDATRGKILTPITDQMKKIGDAALRCAKATYVTEPIGSRPPAPTDDELAALIKPLWLASRPSKEAQSIRAALSTAVDDSRYPEWALDYVPDYVWDLVDIAAQRGMDVRSK